MVATNMLHINVYNLQVDEESGTGLAAQSTTLDNATTIAICVCLKEAMRFISGAGNTFENVIKHIFFEIRDGKYRILVLLTVNYITNVSLPTAKKRQRL